MTSRFDSRVFFQITDLMPEELTCQLRGDAEKQVGVLTNRKDNIVLFHHN